MKLPLICCFVIYLLASSVISVGSDVLGVRGVFSQTTTWYVGGSGSGNVSSIQEAIDLADSGDLIFVFSFSSPYFETILVDKPLWIQGENRSTTVIDGGNSGDVVTISADDCILSNFTVRFCGGTWSTAGIRILGSDTRIVHNIITQARNGIFAELTTNNTFADNIIEENGYHGIRVEYSRDIIICNNTISSNVGNGIYFWATENSKVFQNEIKFNEQNGIMLGEFSTGNHLFHNTFRSNVLDNAFDAQQNSWDNGYPSGGNFWDDYSGVDQDGDAIGDTPYLISNESVMDRYPLMYPYPSTEPLCSITLRGGVGVVLTVEDIRGNDGEDLDLDIYSEYAYRFRSDQIIFEQGALSSGERKKLRINNPFLVGVGSVNISIWAGNIIEKYHGWMFGPFVFLEH